jgi:hypothetical protein
LFHKAGDFFWLGIFLVSTQPTLADKGAEPAQLNEKQRIIKKKRKKEKTGRPTLADKGAEP